jgi:transposase
MMMRREGTQDSMPAEKATSVAGQVKRITRQQRSAEEKRRIVQELLASESSVTEFARARGLRANQIFKWRRLHQQGPLQAVAEGESVLLPVKIAEPNSVPISKPGATGIIHIEFGKARVSIEGNADAAAVRAVLGCLAR